MIEDFQGKIINDDDVSLPKMEDYYYNSLTPMIDIDKITEDSQFFIEDPPDGEDAVGLSADGTMFIIKTGAGYNVKNDKAAFNIPNLSIYTGMNHQYNLTLDISKCDVGANTQNNEFLMQLGGLTAYKNYINSKISDTKFQRNDIRLRLLYTDGPQTPKYTVEELLKSKVKKIKFKDMKTAGVHAQPFQAEFDRNNGTLSLDIEPAIREYTDDDDVYVYDNVVQVWPYEVSSDTNVKIIDDEIGFTDNSDNYFEVTENNLTADQYNNDYFRSFSDLDNLGRCHQMVACFSKNHDFAENDRGTISSVAPAGWHSYSFQSLIIKDKNPTGSLYNRSHLLAYIFSGELDNSKNLFTGTYACNQTMYNQMEKLIKDWANEHPDSKILYRVTPNYTGDELLPRTVKMEVVSVEDNGASLNKSIVVRNLQKGIYIYYKTGEAWDDNKSSLANKNYAKYYVMNTNHGQLETINLAFRLRNDVIKKVLNAEDSRVVISTNGLNRRSDYKPPYDTDYTAPISKLEEAFKDVVTEVGERLFTSDEWYKYSGFNMYGLDKYGKSLGIVYIKSKEYDNKWINLNKYIIWKIYTSDAVKQSDYIPDNMDFENYYNDPTGERFKSWTYDIENINYQDNFWTQLKNRYGQDERRQEIQKEVFKKAGVNPNITNSTSVHKNLNSDYKKPNTETLYNCLKDWTISIGDVTFFCPPSAIRILTQTNTERLPVLRAKGSMAKNIEKSDSDIELNLFFNNDYGINGQEWTGPIWENKDKDDPRKKVCSDEKVTYYMNGLRALIAEFKFTPFLPVINTYLNRTMKIAAVSLEQLDIETVPNFPRLIKAVLRLKKFDYKIYMPQVPDLFVPEENSDDNEVENPYTQCINYDVMRYYYQKPLQYGNLLAQKLNNPTESGYSFNSLDFIKDTVIQNKTCLMPCNFTDPSIDIYIANEDHLKKLLNIKKDAINRMKGGADNNFVPDVIQSRFIANTAKVWETLGPIIQKYKSQKENIIKEFKEKWTPFNNIITFSDFPNKTKIIQNSKDLNDFIKDNISDKCYEEISKKIKSEVDLSKTIKKIDHITSNDFRKGWFHIFFSETPSLENDDLKLLFEQYTKENKSLNTDKDYTKNDGLMSRDVLLINFDNIIDVRYNKTLIDVIKEWKYKDTKNTKGSIDIDFYNSDNCLLDFYIWCASQSTDLLNSNQEATDLKESIDWENAKSIKYDLIAEDVRVDLFQSSMANNFARISLLGSDGFAPQYMGSSDIHIVWKIRTKNEELAMIMQQLPEFEAHCMRDYHMVLPCFPIRIDSEFTRMLGVFEVSIEHVGVNTVPNFPGLYDIEVRAISVDRTLRNKEALRSIDNDIDNNKNGQSGKLDNKGLVNASYVTQRNIKSFSDLDDKLAQAELYPDLELPTIGELGQKGFIFIRYKEKQRDKNDLFVDPDFYFYYPFSTAAESIRAVVQAMFNESDLKNTNAVQDATSIYSDNSGNSGVNFSTKDGRVNFNDANDLLKEEINRVIEEHNAQIEGNRDLEDLELAKKYSAALIGDPGKWDIATTITASFTESFYLGLKDNIKQGEKISDSSTESFNEDKQRRDKLKELYNFYTEKLSGKDEAINDLYKYLQENPIIDSDTNNSIAPVGLNDFAGKLDAMYLKKITNESKAYSNFIKAVCAAYTGSFEYNKNLQESQWKGIETNFWGEIRSANGTLEKATEDSCFDTITAFGSFNIRQYKYAEINQYLDSEERKELLDFYNKQSEDVKLNNTLIFTLDPYYRYKSKEVQKEYFKKCQTNISFASQAFIRNMLWWLIQLYKADFYPNISLDIMGKATKITSEASKRAAKTIEEIYGEKAKNNITTIAANDKLLEQAAAFVERNEAALARGKIFTAIMFALYDLPLKSNPYYNLIYNRDYDALNKKIQEVVSDQYKLRNNIDTKDALFRKFVLALCGYKEIAAPVYVGRSREVSPASKYMTNHNTKLALAAAMDPSKYLFHSCYDMIRNDYRGRMLKAFPTFYCIFMDEGKEVGLWKLHDNFYSINSIVDISIVKSRKIAADTCTITLSNNYQTFTTDDEDGYINYRDAGFWDLWDSVFHEDKTAAIAEKRRLAAAKINKAKLQPGIRIHIKEGYGSDARSLAGVFNGIITNVEPNAQAINIVAQGNGIELMNPIMEDRDADEIQYKDTPGDSINNTEGGGATPHTILKSFLTIKGGSVKKYLQGKYSKEQWVYQDGVADVDHDSALFSAWEKYVADVWNKNLYGVVHFGDPDYEDTFQGGEIIQNIYEASALPNMAREDLMLYSEGENIKEPPYISFEPRGKTVWDIMHICQSVTPDFITGTASFGFRDTIFFGKPHYYYAYQYKKYNGIWVEQRKPFQQLHLLYSDYDIISNNITASSEKIKTVATGLYKDKAGWVDRNKDVGPLWVDKSIYPESQKSVVVDTRLKMKDCNGLLLRSTSPTNPGSFIGDFTVTSLFNLGQSILNVFPITGVIATISSILTEDLNTWSGGGVNGGKYSNHKKVAWTATANSLKESIKEMYQGDIIIIGNPSIKPYDRLWIKDNYNDMSGSVLVRDVVHNLNSETGFTTTIHVDTISTVDDNSEKIKQDFFTQLASNALTHLLMDSLLYGTTLKGLGILSGLRSASTKVLDKFVNTKLLGADLKKAGGKTWELTTKYLKNPKIIAKGAKLAKGGLTAIMALGAGGGPIGLAAAASAIATIVITDMITTAIVGNIQDFFLYSIKNEQVLQIFPLKKNGMVYTAGLEGNLGLVYGSPTYNQLSPIKKAFSYLFADTKETKVDNVFVEAFQYLFATPEIQAEAAKYTRDYSYAQKIGTNPIGTEIAIESTSIGIARKSSVKFHKKNSFDMSLGNRIVVKNKDNKEYRALTNSLKRYYIENIDSLLANSASKNQRMIKQYNPLKHYINSKFLEILHDNLNAAKNIDYQQFDVVILNQKVKINGIKNVNIVDVPFLTDDSLVVLKDICDYCFRTLDIDNIKDNSSIEKKLNGTKIVLESALRIGDENMQCSSGYSFSIKGTGALNGNSLTEKVKACRQEIQDKLNKLGNDKKICWSIYITGNNENRIYVAPESPLKNLVEKSQERSYIAEEGIK